MKRFTFFLLLIPFFSSAQFRNSIWCFGDSAMVDFTDTANITIGSSILRTRGSCATISDSVGNLLFYAGYDADVYTIGGPPYQNGEILNRLHQTMLNGDSIQIQLWYREAVIVNHPGNNNLYYVFTLGVTGGSGFFYSLVDMSLDSGRATHGGGCYINVPHRLLPNNNWLLTGN